MSNEKIQELQDEMKVLKNEVRQILLDIREHLLDHPQSPPSMAAISAQAPAVAAPQPEPAAAVATKQFAAAAPQPEPLVSLRPERDPGWRGERPRDMVPMPPAEEDHNHNGSHTGSPNLLTIAALPQWFGNTMSKIGQEQTKAVIEIYEIMEHLPPTFKDILLRIACLDGGSSPAMEALLELDSLLSHGRKGHVMGNGRGNGNGHSNGNGTNGRNGKSGKGKVVAIPPAFFDIEGILHR